MLGRIIFDTAAPRNLSKHLLPQSPPPSPPPPPPKHQPVRGPLAKVTGRRQQLRRGLANTWLYQIHNTTTRSLNCRDAATCMNHMRDMGLNLSKPPTAGPRVVCRGCLDNTRPLPEPPLGNGTAISGCMECLWTTMRAPSGFRQSAGTDGNGDKEGEGSQRQAERQCICGHVEARWGPVRPC